MKKDKYIFKRNKKLTLELLVKVFYAYDINADELITLKENLKSSVNLPQPYQGQVDEVVEYYKNNSNTVDETIASHLVGWRFDRLGKMEKAVLRVGTVYIMYLRDKLSTENYQKEIRYTISFLLEILECYGAAKDSVKFVNGVLGRIFREQLSTETMSSV